MKIYEERALKDLEYWGGAKAITNYLTDEEFDIIEEIISETKHKWSMIEINDLFWFDEDFVLPLLGYKDFDDFYEKRVLPPWNT